MRSLTGLYNGLLHNPTATWPYKVVWDTSAALLRLVALWGRRWEKESKENESRKNNDNSNSVYVYLFFLSYTCKEGEK